MKRIDEIMMDAYGVSLGQMAESAGLALAALAFRMMRRQRSLPVAVLAGTGGNGAGALVAARRLSAWGADVRVVLSQTLTTEPSLRLSASLGGMGVGVTTYASDRGPQIQHELHCASLVIDGLIGYSLRGAPRGEAADLIRLAHGATRILSLDLPSGLDPTTGVPSYSTVKADATLTIALPKMGLLLPAARPYVGRLYVADIGIPPQAYAHLGIEVPQIFDGRAFLRLTGASARK